VDYADSKQMALRHSFGDGGSMIFWLVSMGTFRLM